MRSQSHESIQPLLPKVCARSLTFDYEHERHFQWVPIRSLKPSWARPGRRIIGR